jgi:hypothetical protein
MLSDFRWDKSVLMARGLQLIPLAALTVVAVGCGQAAPPDLSPQAPDEWEEAMPELKLFDPPSAENDGDPGLLD